MQIQQWVVTGEQDLGSAQSALGALGADLVLVFGAVDLFSDAPAARFDRCGARTALGRVQHRRRDCRGRGT